MMKKENELALKVDRISKQYRLGVIGTGTISHDLNRWFHRVRGKEDPYATVGVSNDRSVEGGEYVWALKDVDFEVEKGEVLGIIGRNGAGKSTLLKLLSRITSPTNGEIKINGRMASLLEVGTGFHPELTGRENIFLNGAILGMTKNEISEKIDEIVEFSGCAKYVDTPVKRYSSGMRVRLGFAVAAFLEPDILIVDEVLAVGDAEFQKKAIGKMKDVSQAGGRTVLFVSHNMGSIRDLCTRVICMKNGMIVDDGEPESVIRNYLSTPEQLVSAKDLVGNREVRRGYGEARFSSIELNDVDGELDPQEETVFSIEVDVLKDIKELYFSLIVKGYEGSGAITSSGLIEISGDELKEGNTVHFEYRIAKNTFRVGTFPLYIWLGRRSEIGGMNYPYDVVDGLYNLNYYSKKSKEELGYNSASPQGYFNINGQVSNIKKKL